MGIGDEIMVTGEVKRQAGTSRKRFAIVDSRKGGRVRWHEIWEGNPRIAAPGQSFTDVITNHGGARPYIEQKMVRAWIWKPYVPEPGEIFLTDEELRAAEGARGRVIVQPTIKAGASPNKQWPVAKWQQLIDANKRVPWLQIGDGNEPRLSGVEFMQTASFRIACAAIKLSRTAVLHEGGLHHAAAALEKAVVVIYGGFIGPRCTGYTQHKNLFHDDPRHPLGCGSRQGCFHCETAMSLITPRIVAQSLEEVLP